MEQEETDKHALNLGKLVSNLQSLEFVLRAFLANDEIASGASSNKYLDLNKVNKGEKVPENAFTNYNGLGQIIEKYNNNQKVISAGLTIDNTLVEIRDAIAHGRASGETPSAPLRLLKFGRPRNNQVEVTYSVLMTKEWFGEQIRRVYSAVLGVSEAGNRLQNGKL